MRQHFTDNLEAEYPAHSKLLGAFTRYAVGENVCELLMHSDYDPTHFLRPTVQCSPATAAQSIDAPHWSHAAEAGCSRFPTSAARARQAFHSKGIATSV